MQFLDKAFRALVTATIYIICFAIVFYTIVIFSPIIASVGIFLLLYGFIKRMLEHVFLGFIISIIGLIGGLLNHWLNIF